MSADRLAFRDSFLAVWRWTGSLCGIIGIAFLAMCWMFGQPISPPPTLFLAILIGLVLAVFVVLFPVYVLPEGVRCYNYWGLYQTIAWNDFGEIRYCNIFGLKYLKANSLSGGTIYIPLYLWNKVGFKSAVTERAGAVHPLVLALNQYQYH